MEMVLLDWSRVIGEEGMGVGVRWGGRGGEGVEWSGALILF